MLVDITGNKYGRLTVLAFHHSSPRRSWWTCVCDCGKTAVLRKDSFAYEYSHQKSCGCLHSEVSSQNMSAYNKGGGYRHRGKNGRFKKLGEGE